MLDDLLASVLSPQIETLLIFQIILIIAALGHYLPLSINQLDIGIPGYMAVGAYTSSILTIKFAAPFAAALIAGGVLAARVALLVDSLAARSNAKGFAFAIISIGSFEVIQVAFTNWSYVGGGLGMSGMPQYTTPTIVLLVLVLAVAFLLTLNGSYIGRAMGAIRDDEQAAEAMGINVLRTKLFVFACGAFLGGVSGGLYAHYALYIVPNYFGFSRLITIQLPIVFGGLDTFWGAIVGMLVLGLQAGRRPAGHLGGLLAWRRRPPGPGRTARPTGCSSMPGHRAVAARWRRSAGLRAGSAWPRRPTG